MRHDVPLGEGTKDVFTVVDKSAVRADLCWAAHCWQVVVVLCLWSSSCDCFKLENSGPIIQGKSTAPFETEEAANI